MDVRYINPFITSSRQVFDMMVHQPLILGKPVLRSQAPAYYAVSAVIGLGGAVTGCVVLGFSQQVAMALAGGISGTPMKALDTDCVDALGEIVNMIAGAAKKDFPGGMTTLSVPNVIVGSHQISYPTAIPIIVIPCETAAGNFAIEVAIQVVGAEGASKEATKDAAAAKPPAAAPVGAQAPAAAAAAVGAGAAG